MLVCCAPRFSHITPVIYELHQLALKQRVHFKILLFAFKAIYPLHPLHLELSFFEITRRAYNLRSSGGIFLASQNLELRSYLAIGSSRWLRPSYGMLYRESLATFRTYILLSTIRLTFLSLIIVERILVVTYRYFRFSLW